MSLPTLPSFQDLYFSWLSPTQSFYIHSCFLIPLLLFVYACLYIYVHMCIEVRGEPWVIFLRSHLHCFLMHGLSLTWTSLIRLGWLASKHWGSTCICLLSTRITHPSHYTRLFHVGSGYQILVVVVAEKALYWLPYLHSFLLLFFLVLILTPRKSFQTLVD